MSGAGCRNRIDTCSLEESQATITSIPQTGRVGWNRTTTLAFKERYTKPLYDNPKMLIVSTTKHNYTILTMKKRTSKIWKITDDEFITIVKSASNMKKVLEPFGLFNKGNNFHIAKKRIAELKIDTSHFLGRVDASIKTRKMTLEELKTSWLTINSNRSRFNLKIYLLKFSLLDYKCANCGNLGEWLGRPITLQLDHINGVHNDNRLENLRFLCPNCHTQTDSYAGKNNK